MHCLHRSEPLRSLLIGLLLRYVHTYLHHSTNEDNRRTLLVVPQTLHTPDDEIRAGRRTVTAQNTILTLYLGFAVLKIEPVIGAGRNAVAAAFAELLHDFVAKSFLIIRNVFYLGDLACVPRFRFLCFFNRSDRAAFRRGKVPPVRLQRP